MRKEIILIMLLVVLVGITACQQGQTTELTIREDVFKGTKALEMTFVPNYPPAKIYSTQGLTIVSEIRNKGAAPITQEGSLTLEGFDPQIISFTDPIRIPMRQLKERTAYDPEGGLDTVQFSAPGSNVRLERGTDSYRTRFVLTACYPYKTTASMPVCIDPNPASIGQEKACTVQSVSAGGGQGGPVTVDYVAVDSSPTKAFFRIKLGNKGGGKILDRSFVTSQNCPYKIGSPEGFQNIGKIANFNVRLGNTPLTDCSPRQLTFYNEEATISCSASITGGNAYKTQLVVDLDYGYVQSISKDVEIIKAPQ